ncbi:hypothetical protein VB712_07135 [Spirulina sp. CCNP1310]|uniref:hypothetical protein n=1 Tax=Spirulina sp. CCNP1310 TaxID=3110249 RepID=UPI002B220AAE|nr:hypothetical protein [Spirulina sp. CCNP1310]MEA5418998.1 hypothetical protein [Spirulina sp. CCNP1310]
MNLDPKLVQRLTRPIHQPGVTNHRMADRLIDRAERLVNRLPLLDQQLARWSAIADLETQDIPIVYAQWGEGEPPAPTDGLQTQPQRIQGDPAIVPTLATLPVAIAMPTQPSKPPDLSRVEPSPASQMGTETGNPRTAITPITPVTAPIIQSQGDVSTATDPLPLEGVTPPLPPNSTDKLPTAQNHGKLSQSFPAPAQGLVPPESITAQVSPQAIAAEPQLPSPPRGPMPVVESFTPLASSSDSSAPMGGAIAPLGPATNQTTGVIQAKLETGATPAQPLEIGADHNAIAPVQAAASLQSATASPIDQPSVIKNPAFDPQVMQAALSLDQPNLNPLPRELPLAAMPPAINQKESGHSELEAHRVFAIAPSPAHPSPQNPPTQAPNPAQSATSEILTTPLSPDAASPISDSMPLVQPSAHSESVTSESVTSKSVTSKSVTSESVTSKSARSKSARSKSATSESATSKSATSESATSKSATPEPSASMGGTIAPLGPPTNQTTGVIQAKLETGAKLVQPLEMKSAAQPLNGGADQSAKAVHPRNRPDIQPQSAALSTIQTRPFTEGIVQAKFAAGAALPMVAPSEGLALSPHPSGFTSLNLAASNPIAAPLTTVPAGVTEPILTPFTPPRFPAVVSAPPLDPAPPPSVVLHARNFRAEQENPLAHPQQAIATVIPRDGGDRQFAPHEPRLFSWVNRIEGNHADGAKGSGAIAIPNRVAISPQPLATPSEQGQDFTFVLPNGPETAKMPQTAAMVQTLEPITPRVQTSRDAQHPGSRVQAVEMSQPISPLTPAKLVGNTSPELVVATPPTANLTAASATPGLPRAIAQPLPPSRNPAHKEQPALAVFSRPVEVSPNAPTALGVTAPAQPSGAASPPPAQSPLKKEEREKRSEARSSSLLTPHSSLLKTAVSPIQPSATRSQRLTPTPQPQIIGNPQGNPTVRATPPIYLQQAYANTPLPTVQAKTEFNPPNLEPLVLSGPMVRSRRTASSQETHRTSQTRNQTPSSPVVISPALPNPPPSPNQPHRSATGPRAKSTTTPGGTQTTPAAVNIDDLVAKVERKVLKRLVVERERRGGQRQWR